MNKILVQGGCFYVDVLIAYIADNTGTILANYVYGKAHYVFRRKECTEVNY